MEEENRREETIFLGSKDEQCPTGGITAPVRVRFVNTQLCDLVGTVTKRVGRSGCVNFRCSGHRDEKEGKEKKQ